MPCDGPESRKSVSLMPPPLGVSGAEKPRDGRSLGPGAPELNPGGGVEGVRDLTRLAKKFCTSLGLKPLAGWASHRALNVSTSQTVFRLLLPCTRPPLG